MQRRRSDSAGSGRGGTDRVKGIGPALHRDAATLLASVVARQRCGVHIARLQADRGNPTGRLALAEAAGVDDSRGVLEHPHPMQGNGGVDARLVHEETCDPAPVHRCLPGGMGSYNGRPLGVVGVVQARRGSRDDTAQSVQGVVSTGAPRVCTGDPAALHHDAAEQSLQIPPCLQGRGVHHGD